MKPHDAAALMIDIISNPCTFPGGYMRVLVLRDGGVICPDCCRKGKGEWEDAMEHGVIWESHTLCEECGQCVGVHCPLCIDDREGAANEEV